MRVKIDGVTSAGGGADLTIVPFGHLSEIDYKKELAGESGVLVKLGKIARNNGGSTLFCAPTDNHGIKKISAFLFEFGKLVSIFDLNEGGKYSPSFGVGSFGQNGKKCGVLIGDDLFDCDLVKALSLCGSCLIIDLYPDFLSKNHVCAVNFYSYVYGLDFICVGTDYSAYRFAGCAGAKTASVGSVIDFPCKRLYREISIKKPGSR